MWNVGLVPERTTDPARAWSLLEMDGVCILELGSVDAADATTGTEHVLGERLRAHRLPVSIGTNPTPNQPVFFDPATKTVNSDSLNRGPLHVDGYMAFGADYPDFVFLLCAQQADEGGESFIVDSHHLLAAIASRPELRDLTRFLWRVPIEQSTPSGIPHRRPIAQRTPGGRLSVIRHDGQRLADDADPADRKLLDLWLQISDEAAAEAPRFRLRAGDFLCLDNYRALHAREAYAGTSRLLHRIWSWSDQAFGTPTAESQAQRPVNDIVVVNA